MIFSLPSNESLYRFECVLLATLVVAYALFFLVRVLRRSRPELAIGLPIAAAAGLRLLTSLGLSITPAASNLRGPDETAFLLKADELNQGSLSSSAALDALTSSLHTWVFALQLRISDFPEMALRITQIGIAVAGLVLLCAAVYDLAGPRAATIAGWLLALEPASIFFSGVLHKEALMLLGGGLVVFGGVRVWQGRDYRGLIPLIAGCAIAVATRPYAGWFLVAAGAAVTLHATLTRGGDRPGRSLVVATSLVLLVTASVPILLEESSDEKLENTLQVSQTANTTDDSNLQLEEVDFSTRENVFLNLPQRIRDVLLRPYPWQVENTSQRLGLSGTVIALATLWLLLAAVARNARGLLHRAAPLVYTAAFLLVAYSLSAGNAGTSFRYRTHLVAFALCLIVVLREARAETEEVPTPDAATDVSAEKVAWAR